MKWNSIFPKFKTLKQIDHWFCTRGDVLTTLPRVTSMRGPHPFPLFQPIKYALTTYIIEGQNIHCLIVLAFIGLILQCHPMKQRRDTLIRVYIRNVYINTWSKSCLPVVLDWIAKSNSASIVVIFTFIYRGEKKKSSSARGPKHMDGNLTRLPTLSLKYVGHCYDQRECHK